MSSREGSSKIVEALIDETSFSVFEHHDVFLRASSSARAQQLADDKSQLSQLQESFDCEKCRAIERVLAGRNSQWINVLLLSKHHFDLSPVEFRDALALRYHRPLQRMPATCDGCEEPMSMEHVDYRRGGLVRSEA